MRARSLASDSRPAPNTTLPLVRKVATSSRPAPSNRSTSCALLTRRWEARFTPRRNAAYFGTGGTLRNPGPAGLF